LLREARYDMVSGGGSLLGEMGASLKAVRA
jgi:hypothetical protein